GRVVRLVGALVVGFGYARGLDDFGRRGRRGADRLQIGRATAFLVLAVLLEERVLLEHPLDLGIELEGRQLEQPDRLLKLRRQREVLRELELERGLHRYASRERPTFATGRCYKRKCSPR